MKLRINTTGVSFTGTRAPTPRTSFESGQPRIDTAQPQRVRAFHVTDADITDLATRFAPPTAASNDTEHSLDDAGPDRSER